MVDSYFFLRHGESDWNVVRRCIGTLDRPLTAQGRAQAVAAGEACRALPFRIIFHSPLRRAAETAQAIAAATGRPTVARADLVEANLGVKQAPARTIRLTAFSTPGWRGAVIAEAETFQQLQHRALAAVQSCLKIAAGAPPLLVGHSAFFRALCVAEGLMAFSPVHAAPYGMPSGAPLS
ncbi:histidine phosphatase family protein [Phenylobacterium sp. J426]|uniref:histidine phosphatase family protein n=1 Tax=Phenylobacterium sp. J426 TaxID=2898439 RepID=UPI002151B684|nr:histidine phosphatase family protein [Phenylobacterium sp. J426]MCR5876715.1 histidine phosphatase family protein [Phenylobacterium sp. J426]